jgi:hypothetical protein
VSDRYCRQPVILISCPGLGLDDIVMAVAPSPTLLFVGRVISGITSATIGTSFACIADVTPANERTLAFVGICSSVVRGVLVGPVRPARRTLLPGLLCGTVLAIYGLAPTGLLFLAGVPARSGRPSLP